MQALALLEGYATAMADALDGFDPAAFTELNHRIHEVFLERCPNAYIRGLAVGEWARPDLARRSSFAFVPGRARGSVEEHEHILALVE